MAIGDTYQFRLQHDTATIWPGLEYTFDYRQLTGLVVPARGKMAANFENRWTLALRNALPSGFSFQRVVIRKRVGAGFDTAESFAVAIAGTLVADPLPEQTTICIQRRCAVTGRRALGRFFFSPVQKAFQDLVDPNRVADPGSRLAPIAAAQLLNLTGTPTNGTFEPVLWHRDTQTATKVTVANFAPKFSVMRSRR